MMDAENKNASESTANFSKAADIRRVRVLWIGSALYFLILLNAFRYIYVVPYQILVVGGLVNAAIITAIVVSMRRVYRRISSK